MDVTTLDYQSLQQRSKVAPCVLTLGFFDGVHRGHRRVIETARLAARRSGLALSVMTFDRHAASVFGGRPVRYLTTVAQKAELMAQLGVDHLYVMRFTRDFAALTPQAFVTDCLVPLGAKQVVAGFDYTFGRGGTTTAAALPALAAGRFTTTVVPKLTASHLKISSTRIRELIGRGEFAAAEALLGHPYQVVSPALQQLPPNGCYQAEDRFGRVVTVDVSASGQLVSAGLGPLRFLRRTAQLRVVGE
ncbi:FAD synthetase family protein [Lacticaseibacillus parakribbianus]|uniref:FAD synthetase family protein n=1 Tax=Lacticaseibacillus parakribbianus TaxID=2970927 RepID=UPI0021CAEFC3|nr:FAD synthetase family protein [Lacticaseibacillus parakribbianus]